MSAHHAAPPAQVGRYQVLEVLGRGADGAVYRAVHLDTREEVALKLLFGEQELAKRRGRLERSAALLMGWHHPHIAAVLEVGLLEDGTPWMAMELVEGRPLSTVLYKERAMEPARAVALVRQVLDALGAAHARGVIHRDIKPHNLLVIPASAGPPATPEQIKVVDFGLAREAISGEESPAAANLTATGQVLGTPRYMAPEQVDHRAVCPASDLYSLGLVLFELLTGRVAVGGDSTWEILLRQLEPKPAVEVNDPLIPPPLRPVLLRAVQKPVAARYATAGAFAAALDAAMLELAPPPRLLLPAPPQRPLASPPPRVLADVVAESAPPPRPRPQPVPRRRPPAALLGAALAALLVLAALGGLGWWWGVGVYGAGASDPAAVEALERAGWRRLALPGGLAAWYGAAAGEQRAAVLALHDLGADPAAEARSLEGLRGQGVAVLMLAHSGYGDSRGDPAPGAWVHEGAEALALLQREARLGADRVFLLGRGLGGATAAELAATHPVGGLILEGVTPSLGEAASRRSRGALPAALWSGGPDAHAALGRFQGPLLLLRGSKDPHLTAEAADALLGPSPAALREVEEVEGAGATGLAAALGERRYAYKLVLFMVGR